MKLSSTISSIALVLLSLSTQVKAKSADQGWCGFYDEDRCIVEHQGKNNTFEIGINGCINNQEAKYIKCYQKVFRNGGVTTLEYYDDPGCHWPKGVKAHLLYPNDKCIYIPAAWFYRPKGSYKLLETHHYS